MTREVFIRVNERGQHVPYRLVTPTHRLDVGPAFARPRDAIRYADALEAMPVTSPLRASAGRITTDGGAPASASAGLVRPADSRERVNRSSATG